MERMRPPAKEMVRVPGGAFLMGSDDFYPEERSVHTVEVDGFWMDEHPVTVAEFRRFVKATGYVTFAEVAPDPAEYPDRWRSKRRFYPRRNTKCAARPSWCSPP